MFIFTSKIIYDPSVCFTTVQSSACYKTIHFITDESCDIFFHRNGSPLYNFRLKPDIESEASENSLFEEKWFKDKIYGLTKQRVLLSPFTVKTTKRIAINCDIERLISETCTATAIISIETYVIKIKFM